MNANTSHISYFKGLNGLRGFAAVLVLLGHSFEMVFPNGISFDPFSHFITQNGGNAVSFFFVLSGFLISYLLLVEIKKTDRVNIRNFYLKRVLRIWPIYFLLIFLVQFLIPILIYLSNAGIEWKTVSNNSLFYYLLILPNIPYLFFDTGKLFHLWSIGVEEQFYLIWAPLVNFFKRHFLKLCVSVIVVKYFILLTLDVFFSNSAILHNIFLFLKQFRIEQMCVGGLGAYWVLNGNTELKNHLLFSRFSQAVILSVLFFFMSFSAEHLENWFILKALYNLLFHHLGYLIIPALFLYLILNVSLNKTSILKLENKVFNFMGTISYGFYVYHFLSMIITGFILAKLDFRPHTIGYTVLYYLLAMSMNTLIATTSYYLFEKKVIALRSKFKISN